MKNNGVDTVLLKFRLNPKRRKRLRADGVPARQRRDEYQIMEDQLLKAISNGRNVKDVKAGRLDRSGTKRIDTGELMMSVDRHGSPEDRPLNFWDVKKDLALAGFNFQDIHIFNKKGEYMSYLVIVFSNTKQGVDFPESAEVEDILNLAWDKCHVWHNPSFNSMTVNIAHISQEEAVGIDCLEFDFSDLSDPKVTRKELV
jgi:hypothetical protein